MPRTRNPYPAEFREQMVALVRSVRSVEGMADVFARGGKADGQTEAEVKELHAKIGRPAVENDALQRFRGPTGATPDRGLTAPGRDCCRASSRQKADGKPGPRGKVSIR